MKVFLGGTVGTSRWRDYVMPRLEIEYFNPVVSDWNEDARLREIHERETCDFVLYVLTPKMEGYYAVGEVTDDSFKRPDRTILCHLHEDDNAEFDVYKNEDVERLSKLVLANGANVFKTLDEVIEFLNSSNRRAKSIRSKNDEMFDVFISYGRKHSLAFARKIHDQLVDEGKKVWFDMNNIPLAVDFQEQIDDGIECSDRFLYIISPHSVKSEYCLKEVVLALKYNKQIIPVLHVEPSDCWDKMHPEIGKRNWIYMRQKEEDALELAKKALKEGKNFDSKIHQPFDDSFENSWNGLLSVLNSHREYVRLHTLLLHAAREWEQRQRLTNLLLVGEDRKDSEKWLLTFDFKDPITGKQAQPPCLPSELQCEFIAESKKNANNLQTDVFISYASEKRDVQERIVKALARHGITSWVHSRDIAKGTDWNMAIKKGIEQADSLIYFISEESTKSTFCSDELIYAISLNKRIIPVLIESVNQNLIPNEIKKLQYIDFCEALKSITKEENENKSVLDMKQRVEKDVEHRKEKSLFEKKTDELILSLQADQDYYNKHKVFLCQAIRWSEQNRNHSILLRGHNLDNARLWLKKGTSMPITPTKLHSEFIHESEAKIGLLGTDVFISYSRKDSDFARKLNENLQMTGKTTWFDQESIASASDFQKEIYKGIESSDNFLFVISPDSVNSPYCADEVEYASKFNKRFITILVRDTRVEDIHQKLAEIQWIDFTTRDFQIPFTEVVRALDIDRDYVRNHTKFAQMASEWDENKRTEDFFLRGMELDIAYTWLQESVKNKKQPVPTQLQTDFINKSKENSLLLVKKERRRQRLLRISLIAAVIGFVIALFISVLAIRLKYQADLKSDEAVKNLNLAKEKELEAKSNLERADKEKERAEHALKNLNLAMQDIRSSNERARRILSFMSFEGGLSPVRNNEGLFGYINNNGVLVIPYKYLNARNFSEDLASVKSNELYGFINKQDELIIDFSFLETGDFKNNLAPVLSIDSLWGYINPDGLFVINPVFSKAANFNEGFALVYRNNMAGVIDVNGNEVIPCQFDSVLTTDLTAEIIRCKKMGQEYNLQKNGLLAIITEPVPGSAIVNLDKRSQIIIYEAGSITTQSAFVNNKNEIISLFFNQIYPFSDGLAKVKLKEKYGYVDRSGKLVIDLLFDEASDFVKGRAVVMKKYTNKSPEMYYINKKGIKIANYDTKVIKDHYTFDLW